MDHRERRVWALTIAFCVSVIVALVAGIVSAVGGGSPAQWISAGAGAFTVSAALSIAVLTYLFGQ